MIYLEISAVEMNWSYDFSLKRFDHSVFQTKILLKIIMKITIG